ncbi:endonuclease/exonuclease/phosphatase family protein [Roseovarius sp. D22-M7]|uniref:endonuclease/exonuclease/phosphatase family protein n=1 Tax=Roseovarius sp. D22-M7 TaxID=3127116 RepID=UPI00300F8E33
MPTYHDLRTADDLEERDYAQVFPGLDEHARKRIIDGVLRLKRALQADLPPRRTDDNLLFASWNIREFGHLTGRLPEAYHWIAEIISHFDLVAIQEVKRSLKDLDILMRLLGPHWGYMMTDITGGPAGNKERSVYLYDRRRVQLSGLSGEVAAWPELRAELAFESARPPEQLSRAPHVTGFITGWKRFSLVNVHLAPGDGSEDVRYRRDEVRLLLSALAEARDDMWTENLVLVGDMNLYAARDGDTVALLESDGYVEPQALLGLPTNAAGTEIYDRMFLSSNEYFRLGTRSNGAPSGGTLDLFAHVFRDADKPSYRDAVISEYGGSRDIAGDEDVFDSYWRVHWRTRQLSDHLPIWIELETDDSMAFLTSKKPV